MYSRIQYISQGDTDQEQLNNIVAALEAGCNWIQLRYKNANENDLLNIAKEVRKLKEKFPFTFIVNDFPHIALKADADGVHLGLEDGDIIEARNILGDKKIIGGTANTIDDAMLHAAAGVNYIGLGPYRFTKTKAKLSPVLGLGGYQGIMQVLNANNIKVPVYAIGGLLVEDVPTLLLTGIHGIAVSGMITNAADKSTFITQLKNILNEATYNRR